MALGTFLTTLDPPIHFLSRHSPKQLLLLHFILTSSFFLHLPLTPERTPSKKRLEIYLRTVRHPSRQSDL